MRTRTPVVEFAGFRAGVLTTSTACGEVLCGLIRHSLELRLNIGNPPALSSWQMTGIWNRNMQQLGHWLAHHRRTVWCLIVLLSIPPVLGLTGTRLRRGEEPDWVSQGEYTEQAEARANFPTRVTGLPLILVLECEDFFAKERLETLNRAIPRIADLAGVEEVVWPGEIPQATLFGTHRLLPDEIESAEHAREIGEQIRNHPLVLNQLLSEDGRTMLVGLPTWSRKKIQKLTEEVPPLLAQSGIRMRITGQAGLWRAHRTSFDEDHERIVLTAASLIVVLALVIFRGLPAIIVSCSGPVFAIFWTLGWLSLFGEQMSELAEIIMPVMILMVGFTDGVHLVVHIRQLRMLHEAEDSQHPEMSVKESQIAAAASAIHHVGGACLLTSLTTAIGFGSLLLADSEIIQGFGRACAIGVSIAFAAAILVIPVMSTSWIGRRIHAGCHRDPVEGTLKRLTGMVDLIVCHARFVSVVGIAVTAALTAGALSLEPDDRLAHRVPIDSEAYQAMLHCDRELGGVRLIRVIVKWPESATNESIWSVLDDVESVINHEPEIGRALSIRQALAVAPGTAGPAKLGMASLLPDALASQFWQPQIDQAQVLSRMQDLGMAHYEPVLAKLENQFADIESSHPGFSIALTGEAIVESQVVQRVVKELFQSLAVAAVIILIVITIATRSIRFGLLSLIPNLFPLVATGAMRAAIDTSLDISSACSFAICLGIAVDDTIHFLTRYQYERSLGRDIETAIHNTFLTVGSALVMTTVVMVAGLGTVLTSQLPTHFLFASMACSTIGAALIGDLILLPALLRTFSK